MPPTVPSGNPSMCWFCDRSCRITNVSLPGATIGIADRQGADLSGRRQIALLQRRRNAQHVGDVVETVGRIVRRQQRGGVHIEREHVMDGVGVFGTVEAMEHRPPRIRRRRRRTVQLAFEEADELLVGGVIRPARRAAAASCRSAAFARPSPTCPASRQSSRDPACRARGPPVLRRWLWQVTQ